MIVAGALEGGPEWIPLLVLAGLVLLGVACVGGVVAWLLARRPEAFVLGTLGFAVTAWWVRSVQGLPGQTAVVYGWVGGAVVGAVLAVAARRQGDSRSLRWLAAGGVAVVLAVVVRSGLVRQEREKAREATSQDAMLLGETLAASPAQTANDLALLAAEGPNDRQVVAATGHRGDGGAEVVVRLVQRHQGSSRIATSQCWRYDLRNEPSDAKPTPVGCPDVELVILGSGYVPPGYSDNLASSLLGLDPADLQDPEMVRRVTLAAVDRYIGSIDASVEVEALDGGRIGIAARVGLTDCLVTLVDPTAGVDMEGRPSPTFDTWHADRALLRSDQPGCRPRLAPPPAA